MRPSTQKCRQVLQFDPLGPQPGCGVLTCRSRTAAELAAELATYKSTKPAKPIVPTATPAVAVITVMDARASAGKPALEEPSSPTAAPPPSRQRRTRTLAVAGSLVAIVAAIAAAAAAYFATRSRGTVAPAVATTGAYHIYDASAGAGSSYVPIFVTPSDASATTTTFARAAFIAPTSCALPCQWTLRLGNFSAGSAGVLHLRFNPDETSAPALSIPVLDSDWSAGRSSEYSGRRAQGVGSLAITLRCVSCGSKRHASGRV